MKRCKNGHYYNPNTHEICPYCPSSVTTQEFNEEKPESKPTVKTVLPEELKDVVIKQYSFKNPKDLIGSGGISQVFKAYDKNKNKTVALKISNYTDFNRDTDILNEISTINSEYIINYIETFETEINAESEEQQTQLKLIVSVLEYVKGKNLWDFLKENPAEQTIRKILIDVLNGLDIIHNKGIIHRDLTLSNILIDNTKDVRAKIIDFEVSTKKDTDNIQIVGTPTYIAPECFAGKPTIKSDIWAFGVMVYVIFTGEYPFGSSNNDFETIKSIVYNQKKLFKIHLLPKAYREIIKFCLIKNEKERISDLNHLLRILESINEQEHPMEVSSRGIEAVRNFYRQIGEKTNPEEFDENEVDYIERSIRVAASKRDANSPSKTFIPLPDLEEIEFQETKIVQNNNISNEERRRLKSEGVQVASENILEAKLLLVGRGDVGKTSLSNKLINPDSKINTDEEQTRGINIRQWIFDQVIDNQNKRQVRLNVWDFGGQDIYRPTHQIFYTKRSVYILVWDARKEEDEYNFNYWLKIISLQSKDSPVVLVMNKYDLANNDIDQASLKKEFGNIQEFHKVSCKTGANISELITSIKNTVQKLPHSNIVPPLWIKIRNHLEQINENYITIDDYFYICQENGLENKNDALVLSQYLHDLGVIIHFSDDEYLEDLVILNPEWITKAIYATLEDEEIKKNNGKFSYKDLKNLWDTSEYPRVRHWQLLRLMEKFELTLKFVDEEKYIIPQLLLPNKPDVAEEIYQQSEATEFEYRYNFMPSGLISRFMCRMSISTKKDHIWKNGLVLNTPTASAVIEANQLKNKIKVKVIGVFRHDLISSIRGSFEQTHSKSKDLVVNEYIPCKCSKCMSSKNPDYYKYDFLIDRLNKTQKENIECRNSYEDISVFDLLGERIIVKKTETGGTTFNIYGDISGDYSTFGDFAEIFHTKK